MSTDIEMGGSEGYSFLGAPVKLEHYTYLSVFGEGPSRPNAEKVFLIKTPTLEIPWPNGLTFVEALLAWKTAPTVITGSPRK